MSAAVEGRIKALARAHALLSDSRWHSADLGALVAEELAPYRVGEADKVEIGGPNVSLPPHMAQGLALALHELATNAAKHGALSSMLGKVSLTWQLRPDFLVLHWIEIGGPRIAPPSARSFGLKVIRASIENQLGGKATFEWDAARACNAPCRSRCARPPRRASARPAATAPASGKAGRHAAAGRRVLLVEDEALVAMMIQDCLTESGHSVIGPISRASEALQAAKEGDYDAAILDINLGDGMAYPVADILCGARRSVCLCHRLRGRHHRRPLQRGADPAEADRAANAGADCFSRPRTWRWRSARAQRRRARWPPQRPNQLAKRSAAAPSAPELHRRA